MVLTWPAAGQLRCGVPVSDRDSPLITVRSGTPRARLTALEVALAIWYDPPGTELGDRLSCQWQGVPLLAGEIMGS
jgi:hypothetical protein